MKPHPTELALTDQGRLEIAWSTGERRQYSIRELREKCPCAACREKRSAAPLPSAALPVLSLAETRPLQIVGMRPVGNYAYSIAFSDGHDTGIYTLDFLAEIGTLMPATADS